MTDLERPQPMSLTECVAGATRWARYARASQLDAVRDALADHVWAGEGYRSPSAWLRAVTGESAGACAITLRLAERIGAMPVAFDAFIDGTLSESGLRLLADTWHRDIADTFARDEQMLVRFATTLPQPQARTVLDAWVAHADPGRIERSAQERFDRRSFQLSELLDGMGRGDFLLDPEGTAVVREAIALLGRPADDETRTRAQRHADALVSMASFVITHHATPPGTKRRRPKVIATIAWNDLASGGGSGTIETGHTSRTVVPAETIRRLACDAGVHRLLTDTPDHKIHYGRQTQSISDPLYDVLTIRDHGCRWPGCTIPSALCEAHHADHWGHHGETEPDNLVQLCWYHHHLLHEQHWRIEPLGAGHFQLHDPHGGTREVRPPMVGLALPTAAPTGLRGRLSKGC